MVVYYRKQKFSKLRKKHQTSRELFTDPEFPPSNNSLFIGGTAPPHVGNLEIVWKRPAVSYVLGMPSRDVGVDICSKGRTPKLVVDGLSSRDLNQGQLGNCWFVAACSALALEKKLWNKVIPDYKSQEWKESEPHRYAGIFHFQFWRLGKWTDIVVDDFLPTIDGKLIYTRSDDDHEFWSALLEKAYAKLAGSYEALSGGRTADALVDFTGGVSETIDIHEEGYTSDEEKQLQLFDTIKSAHKQKALISCNIALGRGDEPESVLDCGLVKGHAYSIIDIRNLNLNQSIFSFINKDMCYLIKLRNPWGQTEWNGPWSDRSEEWTKVTKKDRIKLGIEVADDGEFWMELSDWVQWFTSVCICRQVNTKLLSLETTWHEALFDGSWRNPMAGGCVNNKDTFCNNPQYSFMILKDDQEVMVSLMQRDVRDQKGMVDRGQFQGRTDSIAGASTDVTPASSGQKGSEGGKTGVGKGTAGAGKGTAGAGKGPTGTGKGPTGTGKGPTGASKGSTGASKGPTGAGKGSTGAGKGSTAVGKQESGSGVSKGSSGVGKAGSGSVGKSDSGSAKPGVGKVQSGTGKGPTGAGRGQAGAGKGPPTVGKTASGGVKGTALTGKSSSTGVAGKNMPGAVKVMGGPGKGSIGAGKGATGAGRGTAKGGKTTAIPSRELGRGKRQEGAVTVEDADVLAAPQATGESGGATQVTLSKQGMNYTIGYHIMKVEENRRFRCHTIQETAATSVYTNKRSVFDKFRLNAGRYVIVPTTFEPGLERDFLLRIFTLKPSKAEYLKQDYPKRSPIQRLFFCCFPKVKAVVTVYLDNAEGLHRQGGANPYCVVKVEKKKARTPIKKSTVDPNFNTKVHFFISRPETAHVTVQIMNRKKIFGDKFMGQREVAVPTDGLMQTFHERLMGKGRQNADMLEGTITFRVLCSTDLHTN